MPLREDQIQRYSRQILLTAVGGEGQERLLARGARLRGEGQALAVAGAYLAASGSAIGPPESQVTEAQVGFLFARAQVRHPAPDAWAEAICALNADAARSPMDGGLIAELGEPPFRFDGSGPWLAIAGVGDSRDGALILRTEGGCEACFTLSLSGLSAPPPGAAAVQLGALAALAFQRALLGLEREGVHAWRLDSTGALHPGPEHRCARCG